MSAAMLFAQSWRIPVGFVAEQQALAARPGQLEASTAMARATFVGPTGQPEVLLDRLDTVAMPTLVMWGGCDYVLPVSQALAAVQRLPRGELALFPDCGHLPQVERPEHPSPLLQIRDPQRRTGR